MWFQQWSKVIGEECLVFPFIRGVLADQRSLHTHSSLFLWFYSGFSHSLSGRRGFSLRRLILFSLGLRDKWNKMLNSPSPIFFFFFKPTDLHRPVHDPEHILCDNTHSDKALKKTKKSINCSYLSVLECSKVPAPSCSGLQSDSAAVRDLCDFEVPRPSQRQLSLLTCQIYSRSSC